MWNPLVPNMHEKYRFTGEIPSVHRYFFYLSAFSEVSTLLQSSTKENIIPTGQAWKVVLWIFRRGCSWFQRGCYSSMLLCFALLPHRMWLGETSILAIFLVQAVFCLEFRDHAFFNGALWFILFFFFKKTTFCCLQKWPFTKPEVK